MSGLPGDQWKIAKLAKLSDKTSQINHTAMFILRHFQDIFERFKKWVKIT